MQQCRITSKDFARRLCNTGHIGERSTEKPLENPWRFRRRFLKGFRSTEVFRSIFSVHGRCKQSRCLFDTSMRFRKRISIDIIAQCNLTLCGAFANWPDNSYQYWDNMLNSESREWGLVRPYVMIKFSYLIKHRLREEFSRTHILSEITWSKPFEFREYC